MFAPPPIIPTRVFARVPDKLRIFNRPSRWATVHRRGQPVDCFIEGPSFDRDGNLYLVDLAWGRIFRVSPDGIFTVCAEYEGEPNGLKIHRDGRIFVADRQRGLLELDPSSGRMHVVVSEWEGQPFQGLNDLVFASNGDLYFTDQGSSGLHSPTGRVFRRRAAGELERVLDCVPSPNGLAFDRDGTLFVNVTRDNAVWRVPMSADGSVNRAGVFVRLSGGIGPDGLAADLAGGLAIAHLGVGVVWLVSMTGEPIARIQSCAGLGVTNVAYGGPSRTTLYITESETGQVLTADLPVGGLPIFSHL